MGGDNTAKKSSDGSRHVASSPDLGHSGDRPPPAAHGATRNEKNLRWLMVSPETARRPQSVDLSGWRPTAWRRQNGGMARRRRLVPPPIPAPYLSDLPSLGAADGRPSPESVAEARATLDKLARTDSTDKGVLRGSPRCDDCAEEASGWAKLTTPGLHRWAGKPVKSAAIEKFRGRR